MAGSKFVYTIFIRTTPEKLFDVLRKPEFTQIWWNETVQECTWEKGASWTVKIPDGRVADSGEVLEFDPPRRFVVSWRNQFMADMHKEGYSRCAFDLEQVEGAVKLTVTHEMDIEKSKLIEGVSNGWPPLLASLKSYIETGEPLDMTRKWPKGL